MTTAIQIVPQAQCDALARRQRQARKDVMRNPLAKAMNIKLQMFYRKRQRTAGIGNVVRFTQ